MDAKGLKVNSAKTKDKKRGIIGCGLTIWPCAVCQNEFHIMYIMP